MLLVELIASVFPRLMMDNNYSEMTLQFKQHKLEKVNRLTCTYSSNDMKPLQTSIIKHYPQFAAYFLIISS